jgi:mannose/cellobiose epimerase-like protein (N-acyl-D-glucosamine 2-epimerase family)/anti-anti-sigma regulatory factor
MNTIDFTFSDTIAGYVTTTDWGNNAFGLKTADERVFTVKITEVTYGQVIRNPGEPFLNPGGPLSQNITPGQYLFANGVFYPENGEYTFEAKVITFVERLGSEYRFEAPDWWIHQIRSLAEFYLNAQFPDGKVDYRNYRTELTLEGKKTESNRQETDTISRMVYGFATAYLLTGEDRYLEAAERGTEYLREHMRAVDEEKNVVYWYHAIELRGGQERKIYASQFGDDYHAIPAYEQIYALAGPVQTYRVTGDQRILQDAEKTVNLFEQYFRDRDKGGYFSHIDPTTFDPRSPTLNVNQGGIQVNNQAHKNWNSNGDHTPAYLINLWLATGDERYKQFLISTADIIAQHFPDFEHSPFVCERFHEDWTQDLNWSWQQNRGVMGHNCKIAWNMMRIHNLAPNEQYVNLAKKIAEVIPQTGMDRQRGGLYDMLERTLRPGEQWHRLVWHDRKAWWQQEQAILAFLILYGTLKDPRYLKLAREAQSFYNAFFPDTDNGGVYFNVLATGTPYLVGTERLKASHSMSGYHSFELCYLATVYNNLLIKKEPMDFYFKPKPGAFKDHILRVQPDTLPPGSVRLIGVWINGDPYDKFDAEAMTITLPGEQLQVQPQLAVRSLYMGNPPGTAVTQRELKVRVRLAPSGQLFDGMLDVANNIVQLTLLGTLNDAAVPAFKGKFEQIAALQPVPQQVVLRMEDLRSMSEQAARALSFYNGTINPTQNFYVVGANDQIKKVLQDTGILGSLVMMDHYHAEMIPTPV